MEMEDQAGKAWRRQPRDEAERGMRKMYLASIRVSDYQRALNGSGRVKSS